MNKFKQWLRKTFTGIYGIDNLYFLLFGISTFLIILNAIVHHWIIWVLEIAVIVYMLFRALSHNVGARRRENDAVFGFIRKIKKFFVLQRNKFKDRKTHVYKKCPKCRAVIRLPKAKGTHTVRCPRCAHHFTVK